MGLFRLQPDFRIQISFRKQNTDAVEMHFECDISPFRIQTLTQSHPRSLVETLTTCLCRPHRFTTAPSLVAVAAITCPCRLKICLQHSHMSSSQGSLVSGVQTILSHVTGGEWSVRHLRQVSACSSGNDHCCLALTKRSVQLQAVACSKFCPRLRTLGE